MAQGKLTVSEINRLSLKEINSLEAKLAEAKVEAEERAKTELKEKIAALIEDSGLTIHEIYNIKPSKKKLAIRFMNPEDRTQTWVGRGPRPRWLAEKLAKGARLADFEV